jgi:hypothetical protein
MEQRARKTQALEAPPTFVLYCALDEITKSTFKMDFSAAC